MIVKPDCPVKLTSFQARRILTQLQLGSYFQSIKGGAETLPPFSGFVNELDTIAKQFFVKTDYNFNDFLNDEHNSKVLEEVFDKLFANTVLNETNVLRTVTQDLSNLKGAISSTITGGDSQVQIQQNEIEEERKGFFDTEARNEQTASSEFKQEEFSDDRAFYNAMFNNTNYLESKFKSKFVNDIIIRSLLIDPKTRTLVNTKGDIGEATINKNLKDRRKEILSRLLENHTVNKLNKYVNGETGTETEKNEVITLDKAISDSDSFNYLMDELENRITKPTFNGDQVDLLDAKVNSLYLIARAADNDLNPEAIKIVNDYMNYVALKRFDDVLKFSHNNLVYVNSSSNLDSFNDDLKYKFIVNKKEEAANANFSEAIKGLDSIPELYNTIITNTPILDINTGLELSKDGLTKPKVQKAFDKFFQEVDPLDSTPSIKRAIIKGMYNENALWEDRNILYTLYKNFFEEKGDDHYGNSYSEGNTIEIDAKASDKYPESYLQTITYNNYEKTHPLMLLLTDPLRNISKITYTDATVSGDGSVKLNELSTTGKNSTKLSIENAFFNELNNKDKIGNLVEKYKIVDSNTSINGHAEFESNGKQYVILGFGVYNGTAEQNLPTELITAISKDFLNIDFDNATVDKDFKQQLTSRPGNNTQSIFPDYYTQFLRQSMKVVMAKHALLYNTEIRSAIAAKNINVDLITGNSLINDHFKERVKAVPLNKVDGFQIKFNKQDTLQPVLDAYGSSKDRVTGNAAKSVLKNKEGNSMTGYSIYNLFTGLQRGLIQTKQLHSSILNYDQSKNVFSNNAIVHDPNLFKGFTYRDAIEVNNRIVPNTKQSALTKYNFVISGGYFSNLYGGKNVTIDPTVYSDKSKNAMATFSNDFVLNGVPYKLFIGENSKVSPETQSIELQYQTSGEYYKKYGNNIVNDWVRVINQAKQSNNITDLFKPTSDTVSGKLKEINDFNGPDGFWYSDKVHPFLRGRDAAVFYASQAGITLNNFVHYQSNGKTLGNTHKQTQLTIKPALIDEIVRYDHPDSSKLKEWLDQKMLGDINQIRKTNFLLSGDAAKFIQSNYPDLNSNFYQEDRFKNRSYLVAQNSKEAITSVDQINPAYRKFFYDWNFLSDNLLNYALGNIHAHKGGNPNAAWTAMTKRNVMAGASIRPFALGLEQGVEEHTRTAYIDDIITPITTIHGDTETVVDLDGGAFVSMTHRLKSWNSLNQQYQGDGGAEQKPFISSMDFLNGQNGMTKFADFVLDKETIRNSIGSDIDFMKLHKEQLYNYPISHLDITKSWKDGVNLNNLDIYIFRREFNHETGKIGKIEQLKSITHVDGNQYKLLMSNPEVPNSAYTKNVVLNTWFDLWQTLGDIDNVAPSKKQTAIFHTTPNGTKVYYEESNSSWEKLLDFESYSGDKDHMTINPKYITQSSDYETNGVYDLYHTITGEHDIVMPKLELLSEAAITGELNSDEYQALGLHNVMPMQKFIDIAQANSQDIQDFHNHIYEQTQDPEVSQHMKVWQPIKGKLIDRIATAGAQKFGQMNMNRSATYSNEARNKFISETSENINKTTPIESFDIKSIDALIQSGDIEEDC